jgi:cytochrome c-type biogenesis protein CcmH
MTAAAAFAVIWPLVRKPAPVRSGSDLAIYRDQLDEIQRDLTTGLLGNKMAEAARVEISRRLLAAADASEAVPPDTNSTTVSRGRRAAIASFSLLSIVAVGFYLLLGSPELAAPDPQSVESLVAQAEAHLRRNPEDGRGWEILGPVYMRLDRYEDAVTAWRNALRSLGQSAEREANLGEALTARANGVVTADAKAAFERALALDDTIVTARYYLGLAAEQDGQREKAAEIWRNLIAEAPAGAFWIGPVRNALARVDGHPTTTPDPSLTQMAGAAGQRPDQDAAMIRGMVERLAARLRQDGSDVDGWVRLVRSYNVLRDGEKSRAATAEARQALAGEPNKLQQFNRALDELEAGKPAAASPAPGPSAAQMAAAASRPPEQQAEMIRGMVEGLAARLRQDGSDVDSWVRLVRSYNVLGEGEKSRAAAAEARQALAGNSGKLQQLNLALEQLEKGHAPMPGPGPGPAPAAAAAQTAASAKVDHEQGAGMEIMVERLAERLKVSGSDTDGWLMLVRSYETLGETDKAMTAIDDARRALGGDREKLQRFNSAIENSKNRR